MRHGANVDNIVTNLCAKFHDDRLCNEKALADRKSDNKKNPQKNNETTFVALGDAFLGVKWTSWRVAAVNIKLRAGDDQVVDSSVDIVKSRYPVSDAAPSTDTPGHHAAETDQPSIDQWHFSNGNGNDGNFRNRVNIKTEIETFKTYRNGNVCNENEKMHRMLCTCSVNESLKLKHAVIEWTNHSKCMKLNSRIAYLNKVDCVFVIL